MSSNDRERSRERDNGDGYDDNYGYDEQQRQPLDEERDETQRRGEDGANEESEQQQQQQQQQQQDSQTEGQVTLYITNLSFQTTDESLKTAFDQCGEISSAQVIKEPVSGNSRGFAFVTYANGDDAARAIEILNGSTLDDRIIKVERAKRSAGYAKTPGRYLGPAQFSARFKRDGRDGRDDRDGRRDDRDGRRDNRRGGGDHRPPRDFDRRDFGQPRGGDGYRGPGGGGGGFDRPYYRDDGRDFRRGPPPQGGGGYGRPQYYDERRGDRSPPRYDYRRERSPPQYYDERRGPGPDRGGDRGADRGGPMPPNMGYERFGGPAGGGYPQQQQRYNQGPPRY